MKSGVRHIVTLIGAAVAACAAVAAGGCSSPHQATAVDVDPGSWERPATVTISNADTVTLRDLHLFLRCNDRFAEDSLTVRIATLTPDGLRFEESYRIEAALPPGPAALAREITLPYRRRVLFARSGDYRLSIEPVRPVAGVEACGIDITKSQ